MDVGRYIRNAQHNGKKKKELLADDFDGPEVDGGIQRTTTTMRSRPALISQLTFPSSPIWHWLCVCICARCIDVRHG